MPPQQPRQPDLRTEITNWYNSIPPITRALLTLTVGTTTISTLGIIRPTTLILYWPYVRNKLQVTKQP